MRDEPINIGGVFRCCVATVSEKREHAQDTPKEGDTIKCDYCKDGMTWHNGAWVANWVANEATSPL